MEQIIENPNDKEEDLKKYGMGKIFLQSIQTLLLKANYCATISDYSGWKNNLDCIIRKCAGRFSKEELKEFPTISNHLESVSLKHTLSVNKDIKGISLQASKRTIVLGKQHGMMIAKYEIFIVKVLDRLNWLVPSEKIKRKPQ